MDTLRNNPLLGGLAHCLVPLFDEFLAFLHFLYDLVRIYLVLLEFFQFFVVFVVTNALVEELLVRFFFLVQNVVVPLKILRLQEVQVELVEENDENLIGELGQKDLATEESA